MSWIRLHRRSALLVGLTLLIPLYLVISSLLSLAAVGFEYAGDSNRLEPRLARMQGLVEKEELLAARSREAVEHLQQLAYPADQDATALSAALQAEIRRIMDAAGLEVSNSQVLPVRRDDTFEQIAVKLTVTGSLPAFNTAFVDIAAHRPQLLVESIDAFPARGQRRRDGIQDQKLTTVMQLMALRTLPR